MKRGYIELRTPKRLLLTAVCACTLFAWFSPCRGDTQGAALTCPRPTAMEKIIGKFVSDMIRRHHYSKKPFDDQVSRQLFDEYFERLDYNRVFFLESDMEEFVSYRDILDDLLLREGNVDFAFDVYKRFLLRVSQWVNFAEDRVERPFDFTLDQEILLDRSEQPWCESMEELNRVWEKRLKNRFLAYTLQEQDAELEEDGVEFEGGDDAPGAEESGRGSGDADTPDTADSEQAPDTADVPDTPDTADVPDSPGTAAVADTEEQPDSGWSDKPPKERLLDTYSNYLKRKGEYESIDILEGYLSTLTRIYDPHSVYMAPTTEEDFDISMKLSLQGIGAVLTTKESFVEVVDIISGGPADLDGRLKAGDRIIAVAQDKEEPVDVVDMPLRKVVSMIRGKKGTRVNLTVLEAGKSLGSVPSLIDIVRDEVKLVEQEAKKELRRVSLPLERSSTEESGFEEDAHADVLLVSLPSFYIDFKARSEDRKDYKSSSRDVKRILEQIDPEEVEGVVLDLRSNGGGSLDEAISLGGLFFPTGPVVQVRDFNAQVDTKNDPDQATVYGGPLVVLVDRFSASASEIVAAALQDRHRAVIVGDESTHGKGTVQTIYHLDQKLSRFVLFRDKKAGSLKFTMAKFYRITGGSTQVKGVTPDISFPAFADHMEVNEEDLPHVLPWDEIPALEVTPEVTDVTPFLEELRRRSVQRRAADEEYLEFRDLVKKYGEYRDRETLPLGREERRAIQDQEERWAERLRSTQRRRRRYVTEREEEQEEGEGGYGEDFVLEEALRIMADLVVLQEGTGALIPVVAASESLDSSVSKESLAQPGEVESPAAEATGLP